MKLRKIIITIENFDFYNNGHLANWRSVNKFYTELLDGEHILVDDSGLGMCGRGVVVNNMIHWCCKNTEVHESKIVPELSSIFNHSHRELEETLKACPVPLKIIYPSKQNPLILIVLENPASRPVITINKSFLGLDTYGCEDYGAKSLMIENGFSLSELEDLAEKLFLFNFKDVIFYYEPGKGLCLPGETNA